MKKKKSSNMEQTTEQNIVYPLHPRLQVFPPTTVRARGGVPCINLPRECRDVHYVRGIIPQTGMIAFVPAACAADRHDDVYEIWDIDDDLDVVARQNGYRTYAPMPAETEGVRYRRLIDRSTGIVMLTPISWPQWARRTKKAEETA